MLFGVVALAMAGCSAGTGSGGFDRAAADAATTSCMPAGGAPAFAIAGFGAPAASTILFSTAADAPPFKAFVEFRHGSDAPIIGGELEPAAGGAGTYAADLPALHAGTNYAVTVQVMQYTNLAPECQKSFAIAVGPLTTR